MREPNESSIPYGQTPERILGGVESAGMTFEGERSKFDPAYIAKLAKDPVLKNAITNGGGPEIWRNKEACEKIAEELDNGLSAAHISAIALELKGPTIH